MQNFRTVNMPQPLLHCGHITSHDERLKEKHKTHFSTTNGGGFAGITGGSVISPDHETLHPLFLRGLFICCKQRSSFM